MHAIVIGRNYSSVLGMVRAAGLAKCSVTVVGLVKTRSRTAVLSLFSTVRASKYVKELFCVEQNRDALMRVLLERRKEEEKQLLLPTDDFAASTIDLHLNELNDYYYLPGIRGQQGEIVRMMDKCLQKSIAEQVGLNVVKGWIVNIKDGQYTIPQGIEYPVFTKPEISIDFNKKCMKRCDCEAELIRVIEDVANQADCPLLVEQYIEFEKEYAVLGASDGTGSSIPGIITVHTMGSGAHKGVTLVGRYSSLRCFGDLKHKLQEYMKVVQLTGLFDIDLYEHNGKIYFSELNLRMGASGYAVIRAGINLPEMMLKYLTRQTPIQDQDFNGEFVFINEKVNLEDYENGFLSWEKYRENAEMADCGFIRDQKDPNPYKVFCLKVLKARLKRLGKSNGRKR